MLLRKGNLFDIYPYKVKYVQYGETIEQWALPSKQWWVGFANKWEHTEIVEFIEVELTEEQLARFEEIKYMPEDFADVYTEYVLNGIFPNDFTKTHPFMLLKAHKDILALSNYILDVDMRLLMQEMGL